MRRLTFKILLSFLTCLIGVGLTLAWSYFAHRPLTLCEVTRNPNRYVVSQVQEQMVQRVSIPKATWEPIFFESINKRASLSKLRSLRSLTLSEGDLEIRLWGGFGLTALEGFVLKRVAGQWSAIHLDGVYPRLPRSKYQRVLREPQSGWEACWQRLVDAGLLTLPDESELDGKKLILDGFSYVMEINMKSGYRTYHYRNPKWQDFGEAKQMQKIGEIISEEFALPEFR